MLNNTKPVVQSMERYYSWYSQYSSWSVCSERGSHFAYEQARQKVADFIHADYHEIILPKEQQSL